MKRTVVKDTLGRDHHAYVAHTKNGTEVLVDYVLAHSSGDVEVFAAEQVRIAESQGD